MDATQTTRPATRPLTALLRGDAPPDARAGSYLFGLVAGAACYGFTIGVWRAPEMGLYVAAKLPLVILGLLLINGLLCGMFAQLLGSGLSLRQTLAMSLASFAAASLILGSLAPVALFAVSLLPAASSERAADAHRYLLLGHTSLIAAAGIVGNLKAYRTLVALTGRPAAARRTLIAWLAINLFVGAQVTYNLRPFFGNPDYPVRFIRPNPFDGSFYEVVWRSFAESVGGPHLPEPEATP